MAAVGSGYGGAGSGDAADRLRRHVPVARLDERAMFGPPVSTLLTAAADAEMLVLGAKGMTSGTRTLAGSVSLACAHRAAVPVVVVHPSPPARKGDAGPDADPPGPPLRRSWSG